MLQSTELLRFGRAVQGRGRAFTVSDDLRDEIKVTCADFALMFRRRISIAFGHGFRLLQYRVRRHAVVALTARQIDLASSKPMKSSNRDELKFVTHHAQLTLRFRDTGH